MPNPKTKLISLIFSVSILSFSVIYLVSAWTEPAKNPPQDNTSAPLNVGVSAQEKKGGLLLNSNRAANGLIVYSGNVGIGTAAPEKTLHVVGTILQNNAGTNVLQAKNASGTIDTWMWPRWSDDIMYTNIGKRGWNIRTNNSSASIMFLTNEGNVGLGTGPTAKLDIAGQIKIRGGSPGIGKVLTAVDESGLASWQTLTSVLPQGSSGQTLRYDGQRQTWVANSTLFNDGNNIGIGTTQPTYRLTIAGGLAIGIDHQAVFAAKNSSGSYETFLWPRFNDVMYINYGSGGFNIRNNSSVSTMFITNDGKVGIGTQNPSQKLDVAGTVKVGGFQMTTGAGEGKVLTSNESGIASWEPLNIPFLSGMIGWVRTESADSSGFGAGSVMRCTESDAGRNAVPQNPSACDPIAICQNSGYKTHLGPCICVGSLGGSSVEIRIGNIFTTQYKVSGSNNDWQNNPEESNYNYINGGWLGCSVGQYDSSQCAPSYILCGK